MGKKEYDNSWFYRRRMSTTIVILLVIVLFLAANVTSGTRIRHDRAHRKALTMVHASELIIPDQVEQTQQVISHGKGHREILSMIPRVPNMTPSTDQQEDQVAQLVKSKRIFSLLLKDDQVRDIFSVPVSEFIWDPATSRFIYELDNPYTFIYKDTVFATLTALTVRFQLELPYEIYYSYAITIEPLYETYGNFMTCQVKCIPLAIEPGYYQGRIMSSEYCYERFEDNDGTVIKRAIDFSGDPYDSMVEFHTTNGIFQRGFQYLSAIIGDGKTPSGGAYISVSLHYPTPPDYLPISGEISRFWIESGWEGTVGDRYQSSQQFTIDLL